MNDLTREIKLDSSTFKDDGMEIRHGIFRIREGDMKFLARAIRTHGRKRGGFMYASTPSVMIDDDGQMVITVPTNTGLEHGTMRYLEFKFYVQLSQEEMKNSDELLPEVEE